LRAIFEEQLICEVQIIAGYFQVSQINRYRKEPQRSRNIFSHKQYSSCNKNQTVSQCNRLDKCGYHYNPKQYFTDKEWKEERLFVCRKHRVIDKQTIDKTSATRHNTIAAMVYGADIADLSSYNENRVLREAQSPQSLSSLISLSVVFLFIGFRGACLSCG